MRKELCDRQGANIASRYKEMFGEKLFPRPRKWFQVRDQHFFALVLSQMDLGNVELQKMQVFVRTPVKYVTKSTDKLNIVKFTSFTCVQTVFLYVTSFMNKQEV